jgi:hypothetical protein
MAFERRLRSTAETDTRRCAASRRSSSYFETGTHVVSVERGSVTRGRPRRRPVVMTVLRSTAGRHASDVAETADVT